MDVQQLLKLDSLNKKQFSSQKDYYDFLMFQIQSHMVEIEDLKSNHDPHMVNEMVDICILSHMLAMSHGADNTVFKERYMKFESKIKANLK